MDSATKLYYDGARALEAQFRSLYEKHLLVEQVPPPVVRECTDPMSPDYGNTQSVLESVWIVSNRWNTATGFLPNIAQIVTLRNASLRVMQGSHRIARRDDPAAVAAVAKRLNQEKTNLIVRQQEDAKLKGPQVHVIGLPGGDQ